MRVAFLMLCITVFFSPSRSSSPPIIAAIVVPQSSVGDETTLLCSLGGGTKPVHFSWTKDGKDVPSSLVVPHHESGFSSVILKNVKPQDQGTYTCHVKSSFGEDSKSAHLAVSGEFPIGFSCNYRFSCLLIPIFNSSSFLEDSTTRHQIFRRSENRHQM